MLGRKRMTKQTLFISSTFDSNVYVKYEAKYMHALRSIFISVFKCAQRVNLRIILQKSALYYYPPSNRRRAHCTQSAKEEGRASTRDSGCRDVGDDGRKGWE